MQRYITTDELARQCNIDNITDSETQYLSDLLEASAETVENKIQQIYLFHLNKILKGILGTRFLHINYL